jgi:hypothetical protein
MAAGQGVLDYITIDDFTPGIVEDFSSLSLAGTHNQSSAKDGAARVNDTYGCLAGPRGGLMPAFSLDGTITTTFPQVSGRMHPAHPYKRVLATLLVSPIVKSSQKQWGIDANWNTAYAGNTATPDSLWVLYQYYYDAANTGTTHQVMVDSANYREFEAAAGQTIATAFTGPDTAASIHTTQLTFGYGALNMMRLIQASTPVPGATSPGEPLIHGAWSFASVYDTDFAGSVPANAKEYSRYSIAQGHDALDLAPIAGSHFLPFTIALEHQGRILAQERVWQVYDSGGGMVGDSGFAFPGGFWKGGRGSFFNMGCIPSGGNWGYTDFNYAFNITPHVLQFDTGDVGGGIAVAQSLSASELFLVKNRGGGVLVRGDVANPTVTRLKGVPDVNGAANIGCLTPNGFVFGTRQGVWVYPGGDVAQKLSPNLDGWFWKPSTMTRLQDPQPYGKFAYFDPYIIAPNNWCMDTRTGTWMRYFPTPELVGAGNGGRTFAFAEVSAYDHFYAIQAGIGNSSTADDYNLTAAHRFKPGGSTGGPAWSWRSQPLIRSRGRRMKVREVVILAQASTTTTMAVTLYGYRDGTPTTQVLGSYTFTIPAAGRPVELSHSFNVAGGDIEVKIVTNGPATLYRIALGYQETQTAHV